LVWGGWLGGWFDSGDSHGWRMAFVLAACGLVLAG